jgi:hypothetical protein
MKYAVCSLQKIILSVLILIVFGSACKTDAAGSAGEQSASWKYEIEITLPGTKSEGRWGHLYYKDKEIPPVFEQMVVDHTLYMYRIREYAWKFGGYEKQEKAESKITGSAQEIAPAEREKGWYRARQDQRKAGTPSTWIWVKRDKLEAFFDPDKLDSFIDRHNLHNISDMLMFERDIEKIEKKK